MTTHFHYIIGCFVEDSFSDETALVRQGLNRMRYCVKRSRAPNYLPHGTTQVIAWLDDNDIPYHVSTRVTSPIGYPIATVKRMLERHYTEDDLLCDVSIVLSTINHTTMLKLAFPQWEPHFTCDEEVVGAA